MVNTDTGLPEDTNLYDYAFLNLKEPEPGRALEAFREVMKSRDFVRMVIDGNGGNKVTSFSLGLANDPYTRNLLGATAPRLRDDNDRGTYVDWKLEEIASFLRKIAQCWDDEKDELRKYIAGDSHDYFSNVVTQRLEGWLAVLSQVVLPNLEHADESARKTAHRLVLEMDEAGVPTSLALPALLHVAPDESEEVAARLKTRVDSKDANQVRTAALGLSLWLEHAVVDGIPAPPDDILDGLISRVLSRKQTAMDSVLSSLRIMVKRTPEFFDEAKLTNLSLALGHLLDDTELPDYENRERESKLGSAIPVELRSRRRQLAAQLAYSLYLTFSHRSIKPPDILERWKQACSQDPLPEVRRACP